jgi:transcriptional regulator with XRE-family HTH domain
MARGFLRIYRTYNMVDKDPAIDRIRTIVQDEGLFTNLSAVADISSVSASTLNNWFHGETMRPQNATIQAVLSSLGYKTEYVKEKDIDVEKERKAGKTWLEKRAEERVKEAPAKRKKKANGHAAPSMKRKYVGERREA